MPATLESKEVQSLKAIADGGNRFSIELYEAIKSNPGNIIVSPISAQIALTLAFNGANGTTAEEMGKVLHLPSSREQVLEGHRALLTGLTESPVLKIATKMFIANHFSIKPEFKSLANTYFLSGLEEKDFQNNSATAREEINAWVETKTNNKIKDLLPSDAVSSDTRIILVNAIHFKADWLHPFNTQLTAEAPFYITPTQTVTVQMMKMYNKKLRYANSEALGASILELPYAENQFSMFILLPHEMDGLSKLEEKLAFVNLDDELTKLHETTCNVELPRFKIEAEMRLKEPLMSMGMKAAFSQGADFSGIASEPLQIDAVIQKAFIEVNEKGTEAAAATGLRAVARCLIIPEEVTVNHPFLAFIRSSNHILFVGAVRDLVE